MIYKPKTVANEQKKTQKTKLVFMVLVKINISMGNSEIRGGRAMTAWHQGSRTKTFFPFRTFVIHLIEFLAPCA